MAKQESTPLWCQSQPDGDLVLVDTTRYVIRRRRVRRVLLATLLVLGGLLIIGRETWLAALGRFAVYDEAPKEAEAIVVLGGGGGERCEKGAALYRAGYAPLVVTSHLEAYDRCPGCAPRALLAYHGVPREAIMLLDNPLSTYEEAVKARALFEERGVRSFLVVTDNYHSRRAHKIFTDVFTGSGIELTMVASTPDWFDPEAWWHGEQSMVALFNEYIKLLWHIFHLPQHTERKVL